MQYSMVSREQAVLAQVAGSDLPPGFPTRPSTHRSRCPHETSSQQACLLTSGPLSRDWKTRPQGRAEGILRKELASSLGTLAVLFRICRQGVPKRWVVLLEERPYGECADRQEALLDAVEAATDVREAGQQVEVWDQISAVRVY